MIDRAILIDIIYARLVAPYGDALTPALAQQFRIQAGLVADDVLAMHALEYRPKPRTVTVPMRKAG